MKKILILGFVFGITLLLTGCEEIYQTIEDEVQNAQNEKFTLTDDHGYSDEYGLAYYIEGTVKNNTNHTYSYVQIQFNVYDENNNVIGSCLDNINNFEANGSWKIKAICTGEAKDVRSYKFTSFSSW